jgi:hypothetical protein
VQSGVAELLERRRAKRAIDVAVDRHPHFDTIVGCHCLPDAIDLTRCCR